MLASPSWLALCCCAWHQRSRQGPSEGGCWLRAQRFRQHCVLTPEQAAAQPIHDLGQRLPTSQQQPPPCIVQILAKNRSCQHQRPRVIQATGRARSAVPNISCQNRLWKVHPGLLGTKCHWVTHLALCSGCFDFRGLLPMEGGDRNGGLGGWLTSSVQCLGLETSVSCLRKERKMRAFSLSWAEEPREGGYVGVTVSLL